MPFLGGLNMHITSLEWSTAAIMEKSKSSHISATASPITTKFGTVTQFRPLDRYDR